ncbi:polymer-forming cytoskeletal protein [Vibrio brasiliensis]|uniref:bactofilin family protein n=1 Tax=Vibrio brasiliensis TaxID=170652 RepID=UPI000906E1F2|nr:polymer-forming cytoskeletal protein [Vibrio brasiliensis]MCG9647036.1 polymer-forming cytoskeletal protein [Vibrio brasiliensis]MCG9749834.1 polymer-forming cytoskeletal protein [Vibrio brasiliensis]MCG9781194.1 polymer-forming cytoskeletal protein [Vibrio brasiliensis]
MGLFSKQNREPNRHLTQTVIADGADISGELKLTCNIQIDGRVTGSIETDRTVTISATGSVEGSVKAERLVVNGHFRGKVYTKSVEILEDGRLEGEVSAGEFTIQKGGVFLGNSKNVTAEEVVTIDSVTKITASQNNSDKGNDKKGKVEQCA